MSALSYIGAFVLLLSLLIFIHELGHFAVARWCGVRVLKFSIGFGPPIGFGRHRLAWKWGDTEWVIAWIPLGGFVKMLGENPLEADDDPEVAHHPGESLPEKNTWQKLAIVFAGPAANLVLPVVIFSIALFVGLPRPAPVVGSVEPGSPGAAAGLAPGDRVVAVAGEPVRFWSDVEDALRERPGQTVALEVERAGEAEAVSLAVAERKSLDEFGSVARAGWTGVAHRRLSALVGVRSADTPAHRAGLRSGELVEAVDGEAVADWEAFATAYAAAGSQGEVTLSLVEDREGELARRTLAVPALGDVGRLGVLPANVLVAEVTPDSAAAEAGLAPGDLILAMDGEPIGSFHTFAERVRTSGGQPIALRYARAGELREVTITPRLAPYDAGFGFEEDRYLIGVSPLVANLNGEVTLDRERNPFVAVPRAVGMTAEVTVSFLKGLGKLVSGEVSRKQLAGPIGIARIAGGAFERGWEEYLFVLVLISINLGILNLLPIPVLDGGQAVIFAIEGLRGSELSLRSREIVAQIGVTFLVLLMGLAIWNDLAREWSRFVERFAG